MVLANGSSDLATPFEVAQKLHTQSASALEILESMDPGDHRELKVTLQDIRTMALLGEYYALKIEGATNLALYRKTSDSKYQKEAVDRLTLALEVWKQYTAASLEQNINPLWTNRVGYVDWTNLTRWAEDDIKIAEAD